MQQKISKFLCLILRRTGLDLFIPDKLYLKLYYYAYTGLKLNLDSPTRYNEKLQWIKLYDRNPLYTVLVDKFQVKKWVSNKIGENYIIPTLGVWNSVDEIEWDKLPNQFVLKATHYGESLGVVICKDKKQFDIADAQVKLKRAMMRDYYKQGREWPYRNVPCKVIAEQFMSNPDGSSIRDYKFFCFDGIVKAMFVATDRDTGNVKFDYYDADFNHLDLEQIHPMSKQIIQKPLLFEDMKEVACKLSKGIPHVRVDLYEINGKIYFGEMTFFHHGGFVRFHPDKWDYIFGEWLQIKKQKETNEGKEFRS